ncbi:MAG: hypothetical protein QGG53_27010 [Planctomycetota bacterium]|jgi:hypothetical protein|nr:hypothetical protein [Planctomycetota bacterium]
MDNSLAAHWKLAGDLLDSSANENHAQGHDIETAGKAAEFNGRSSFISIPKSESLQTGTGDFSICAHVHTEKGIDDPIGDIVSCFDPEARRGFNLNIKRHSAAPGSLANNRNVHFGIDNGDNSTWQDCGRPGNARFVMALAVHDGSLYAGTYEEGENETGHVYRYAGEGEWEDCGGSPDGSNAVMSLAPFQGKLHAGTGRLKGSGSALEDSINRTEGGKVYRLENGEWIPCGELGPQSRTYPEYVHDTVHGLEVFKNELYGVPLYTQGLFRCNGEFWEDCGSPGKRAFTLGVYRGQLLMAENGSKIYRFDCGENWSKWTSIGDLPGATQNYSMAVYQGRLHIGTWPNGEVFRLEENGEWTDTGRLGEEKEVMGMAVYNGKLYAGTLPLAHVYRYDGDGNWTCTGQIDATPDVVYRRAWSTAVYQGRLFYGTLPTGHVLSLEAGRSATYDHQLDPGWKHIAAIRNGNTLELFIDGEKVATSSSFNPSDYDLSNDQPVTIGKGAHDHFHGRIGDVRFYRRALQKEEIKNISNASLS